jgi:hypothetical protein
MALLLCATLAYYYICKQAEPEHYPENALDALEINTEIVCPIPQNKKRHNKNEKKNEKTNVKSYDVYTYNGFKFLSTFPKSWTYDSNEETGINCSNCIAYCCIEQENTLPLFLGYCLTCSNYYKKDDNYTRGNFCELIIDVIIHKEGSLNDLLKLLNDEYKNLDVDVDVIEEIEEIEEIEDIEMLMW